MRATPRRPELPFHRQPGSVLPCREPKSGLLAADDRAIGNALQISSTLCARGDRR
jgi:hypothetical protein